MAMQEKRPNRPEEPGRNLPAQGFGSRYEQEHRDIHSNDIENAHAVGIGASGGRRMVEDREDFEDRTSDSVY